MSLANASRQIEISPSVAEFKQNLIKTAAQKHPQCEVLDCQGSHTSIVQNAGVRCLLPVYWRKLGFLYRSNDVWNIDLNFIKQHEDLFCWQFATKGFSTSRKISSIIKTLAVS